MNDQTRPTGTSLALVLPTDARELRSLAEFISTSRLIPAHFQKSPADCWMVMDFCREKKLNFFATVGHCSVVKNSLFFDGQLSAALLNISGFLADRLSYEYERHNGVATAVVVSARLVNETTPRTVRVELAKVKTENKVWITQPEQQLGYSGARIWGRRHLPEVLLGMKSEGETIDITPNAPGELEGPVVRETPPLEAPKMSPTMEQAARSAAMEEEIKREREVEVEDEPVKPGPINRNGDDEAEWREWTGYLLEQVRAAPDADTINEWTTENFEHLTALQKASAKLSKYVIDEINVEIEKHIKRGT